MSADFDVSRCDVWHFDERRLPRTLNSQSLFVIAKKNYGALLSTEKHHDTRLLGRENGDL